MFRIETNKYSHATSSAPRIVGRHSNRDEAIAAAQSLWNAKTQRWVYVYEDKTVHFENGKVLTTN